MTRISRKAVKPKIRHCSIRGFTVCFSPSNLLGQQQIVKTTLRSFGILEKKIIRLTDEDSWTGTENWTLQGPVVQSVVSLTSSLRVISLTVLADSIHNILIFFVEKM